MLVHGTANGYTNHRCRCDECRAAKAVYQAAYRKLPGTYEKSAVARERRRVRKLQQRYGITATGYAALLDAQGDACAICRRSGATLHVDHDHETGAVRGLLCFDCNTSLGKLGDNLAGLLDAVAYLAQQGAVIPAGSVVVHAGGRLDPSVPEQPTDRHEP